METTRSILWRDGRLRLLDQRRLPEEVVYVELASVEEVAEAIRGMLVRGAPAIGAAAAYGLLLALPGEGESLSAAREMVRAAARRLASARPTAVNLRWALERLLRAAEGDLADTAELRRRLTLEAERIAAEDVEVNRAIGQMGLQLVPAGAKIIHHCNTGFLATVDYGTALGIIRAAHEAGRAIHVFVDETRPRLQGARLTTWELDQLGIPHTLIVDGAAAHLMRTEGIDLCLVGCDRVAANGDVANKIGTYQLAIAARAHNIPFYVAAPTSTIDLATPCGDAIPIEERGAEEVVQIGGTRIAPIGTQVRNPAFDVTPAEYVSAIITERGIVYPPFPEGLQRILQVPADAVKEEKPWP